MTEAELRAEIVAEARSWTGTPYHSNARIKGAGVDCAMYPAEVFERVGVIPHITPQYSSQWMLHHNEEQYLDQIRVYAREIDPAELKPGDLIVWKFGRTFSHSAIVTELPFVIHCAVRGDCVFEMNIDQDSDYQLPRPRKGFSVFAPDGKLLRKGKN